MNLTIEQVAQALPANLKSAVTQSLVDRVNAAVSDPIAAETIKENFISYTRVLQDGKFKTESYLDAVTYVSFKLMGYSNQDAYIKTFPQRHANLIANGATAKDIAAYVSVYNKGKLVNLILEQTLVPSWVLNQDAYQKAINVQVELMTTANSELVRTQAANSILTHLAKPKEAGPLINIDMRQNSGLDELKGMLTQLAEAQTAAIEKGVPTKVIAEQVIHDAEIVNG